MLGVEKMQFVLSFESYNTILIIGNPMTENICLIVSITHFALSSSTVFFNLGSAEPTGSANSLQRSARILILVLFLVSRFRQKFNTVSKVPRLEKG